MIGRITVFAAIAAAVLYVAVAMAAALARVGPHEIGGDAAYAVDTPGAVFDAEIYDLRTEDVVP